MPIPMQITIRPMTLEDEAFVSTCSHVDESPEIDACAVERLTLLHRLVEDGAVVQVALRDGAHAGFAYGVPIERASWGPLGDDLLVVPCLFVLPDAAGRGIGRRLIEAVEAFAREADRRGLAVIAYRDLPDAEWFMPAAFFERLGFDAVDTSGREALLWKPFEPDARPPRRLVPTVAFEPVEGKVAVDLFWNGFCQTSAIEAARVREVCAEFGDRVLLREVCAEDREAFLACQIPRAILIDGTEIGWGYEAPKEGIRTAIIRALRGK